MERLSDIDRRTYLRGLYGATALAGGTAMTVGGVTGGEDTESDDGADDEDTSREHPAARPLLWDASGSMSYEIVMHYDGDPAHADGDGGGTDGSEAEGDGTDSDGDEDGTAREGVVHVVSESLETGEPTETSDYAAGLVNLRERTPSGVALEDLQEGALTYDYYRGPEHTAGAPDELFLVVQTPEQAESGTGLALFKSVNDDASSGEWQTLEASTEMEGDGWRAIEVHDDPEEMLSGEGDETIGEAVARTARSLRDQEPVADLFAEYEGETEIVGVGFGVGNTGEPVTVDIYYDNLAVDVVPEVASITFNDQQVGRGRNQTVVVDEVAFPEPGGYIDIHDPDDTEDAPLGEIKGAYDQYLEPGVHRDIPVTLFEDFNCHEFEQDRLRETAELMAMPHADDPNDEVYTHFCGHGEGPPEDGGFFDPPDGDFPDDIVDDTATIRVGSEDGRGQGRGENRGRDENRGRGRDNSQGRGRGRGPGGGPPGGGGGRSPGYTVDFPVVLPMELSFEPESVARDEETRAQLRFRRDEVGVHRNDLRRNSVALYAFSQAAPPLGERVDAPAGDVIFKDDGYDVEFTGGDIADLEHLGDDGGRVLVAGEFHHAQVVWFLGEGEIEVTD